MTGYKLYNKIPKWLDVFLQKFGWYRSWVIKIAFDCVMDDIEEAEKKELEEKQNKNESGK